MSDVMLVQGTALRLPLQDGCVQCVVCSPPYFMQRDYQTGIWVGGAPACSHIERSLKQSRHSTLTRHGADGRSPQLDALPGILYRAVCGTCGAERHDQQLGMEALHDCLAWARNEPPCDIPCYICQMRRVFAESYRVLRQDGVMFINIADSYNAAGRTGHGTRIGYKQGTNRASATGADACRSTAPGLKEKDLCGIPHRLALALQSDGWYWRSDIIWEKPSAMPESVTDRCTRSHEYIFMFSKAPRYFFDGEAIKEGIGEPTRRSAEFRGQSVYTNNRSFHNSFPLGDHTSPRGLPSFAGRNARTVWRIPSEGFSGAHFATFPTALASRCILAGSSTRCCPQCHTPYARQTEHTKGQTQVRPKALALAATGISANGTQSSTLSISGHHGKGWADKGSKVTTTGFAPTCSCITQALADGCRDPQHMDWLTTPVPSLVLDPFSGSGTTALTARALGRHGVGVELSWEYLKLSRERLGLAALARWQGPTDSPSVTTSYEGLPLFTTPEEST